MHVLHHVAAVLAGAGAAGAAATGVGATHPQFGQYLGAVGASDTFEVPNPSFDVSVTYTADGSVYARPSGNQRRDITPRTACISLCCFGILCGWKKRSADALPIQVAQLERTDDSAELDHVTFHPNGTADVTVRMDNESPASQRACMGIPQVGCCYGICWK